MKKKLFILTVCVFSICLCNAFADEAADRADPSLNL
jgi:hypothetical protein